MSVAGTVPQKMRKVLLFKIHQRFTCEVYFFVIKCKSWKTTEDVVEFFGEVIHSVLFILVLEIMSECDS